MTSAEIRGAVLSYYRIRDLLDQPLTDATRDIFNSFLQSVAADCEDYLTHPAEIWAMGHVGPVLAAALGSSTCMKEDVTSQTAVLRIFGVAGDHAISNEEAWSIVCPYAAEPTLSPESLAKIRRKCGIRLNHLPDAPTPVDVLEEMTRQRCGAFAFQVGRWLSDYFQQHAEDNTEYGVMFRKIAENMEALNQDGRLSLHGSLAGRLNRGDWESIVQHKSPHSRVLLRAAYAVTRQFLAEYWCRATRP